MKSLALFDFDGTLTYRDSLADFIRFARGRHRMMVGAAILSPTIIGYKLKLIGNDKAKEKVLSYFFQGFDAEEFSLLGKKYALECIPKILRPSGVERLNWHIEERHEVVIVSASPAAWLKAWTESLGIGLIGTLLEEKNGKLTGRYNGLNCHGKEKVCRIRQEYNLNSYDKIYAYGDTPGDHHMLELAHEAFYRHF